MFKSGQTVELTVKERDINLNAQSEFKFFKLSGTVQRSAHYDPPETIRLFTADKRFPVSVIPTKNIVEVSGNAVNLTKTDSQTWDVAGSKGAHYTVTRIGGDYKCTCIAGQFNRLCKHINQVKSNL